MSKIGLKSNQDWDDAPADATHTHPTGCLAVFYKWEMGCWRFYSSLSGWNISGNTAESLAKLISKEEDLGIMKTFTKADLKDGMMFKPRGSYESYGPYFYRENRDSFINNYGGTISLEEYYNDLSSKSSDALTILEIYEPTYISVWKRPELSAQDKQILELEETIKKASEQIKALKEGK